MYYVAQERYNNACGYWYVYYNFQQNMPCTISDFVLLLFLTP